MIIFFQLDRRIGGWSYTPQGSILDHHQRKQANSLQSTYDRSYPKTLESLAEKVSIDIIFVQFCGHTS